MFVHFLKIVPLKKILKLEDWKKDHGTSTKKENFKPKLKRWQTSAEYDKRRANIRWELEGEKCSKTFFKVLERQNLRKQTMFELYTENNKSKYSSNLKNFFKSAKKIRKLYAEEILFKTATTEFLSKVSNRKKIYNEQFYINLTILYKLSNKW